MIWAAVSSQSCFCWLCRASPSLAAKNIISLVSVSTLWWRPCGVSKGPPVSPPRVHTLVGSPPLTFGSTCDSLPTNSLWWGDGCHDHDGDTEDRGPRCEGMSFLLALRKQVGRWQETEGSLWELGWPSSTSQQETRALKSSAPGN